MLIEEVVSNIFPNLTKYLMPHFLEQIPVVCGVISIQQQITFLDFFGREN